MEFIIQGDGIFNMRDEVSINVDIDSISNKISAMDFITNFRSNLLLKQKPVFCDIFIYTELIINRVIFPH